MLPWDGLWAFRAVAEAGSMRAAAEQLGVSHPTVSRHLRELQEHLGAQLLERVKGRWLTTPAGEEMLTATREAAEILDDAERKVSGHDMALRGSVRITVPEAMVGMLAHSFERFASVFPELQVALIVSDSLVNLTRREADLALRLSNKPPDHLVGRRLAETASAVYASKRYAACADDLDDLAAQRWIGWDDAFVNTPVARWMRANVPDGRVAFKVNSIAVLQHALHAGIGVGLLGTFLGDADDTLVRVTEPIDELAVDLWLLTHADLRRNARVRACMDHMQQAMAAMRN
jgi:DNA-binding transcriptional LysR family regulator